MERWPAQHSKTGSRDLRFKLSPGEAPQGKWTIVATSKDSGLLKRPLAAQVSFLVAEENAEAGFDLAVQIPESAVASEDLLTGLILGTYRDSHVPVKGLLIVKLVVSKHGAKRDGAVNSVELNEEGEDEVFLIYRGKSGRDDVVRFVPELWKGSQMQEFKVGDVISLDIDVYVSQTWPMLQFSSPMKFELDLYKLLESTRFKSDALKIRLTTQLTESISGETVESEATTILHRRSFVLGIHESSCKLHVDYPITLKVREYLFICTLMHRNVCHSYHVLSVSICFHFLTSDDP